MPRGGRLFISTTSTAILSSLPRLPFSMLKLQTMHHKSPECSCSNHNDHPTLDLLFNYKEAFSNRMAMAGIRPHHRVALGVSGGPDSMALCVLAAAWKSDSLGAAAAATGESNGFIDGLLAIVVDHGLRPESGEEARLVHQRVSNMGIRCEIALCEWKGGKPTQGHLQEEARDMRYEIFQKACIQHQFGVLLIAHHADDQAELFIIRLSRNSSVLGLAGMAFTSELFSKYTHSHCEDLSNGPRGIRIVRPLLDFTKHDLYKICQESGQNWVEDPSNSKPIFVRNRIRMSLGSYSSSILKSEIQSLISLCRKTRSYVDKFCSDLVTRTVTVTDQGYAIIDLEALNPSCIDDICLTKFLAIVLQFISQRQRPVRGSTLKLVMDYIRTSPCKTCLTAAGCYLCPAPGSKGTKLLICCSVNCPPKMEPLTCCSVMEKDIIFLKQLEEIIVQQAESCDADGLLHYFLGKEGSGGAKMILNEAKRLNILSESTYTSIVSLQEEENQLFKNNSPPRLPPSPSEVVTQKKNCSFQSEQLLHSGQMGNFMNRFFISWKKQKSTEDMVECKFCQVDSSMALSVRPMEMSDWLYLAELSKCQNLEEYHLGRDAKACIGHAKVCAERVVGLLKSVPVAARKSFPVLVNNDGVVVSIPSLGFKHCPCLEVYCRFKPRVPLGGGYTSFL